MPQLQYYPVRETLFSAEAGTRYVSFGLRCCAPEQGAPLACFYPRRFLRRGFCPRPCGQVH